MTDFFYEGGGRRRAVDALFEEIHGSAGVILLIGESGSGRSTVLNRFCAEADPDVLTVGSGVGDILMSAEQCLAVMATALASAGQLGGAFGDNPDLVVQAVRDSGRQPVFVIDDAHELGEQPLAVVAAFCAGQGVPLILAGDHTLVRNGVAHIALSAFSLAESEDFIAAWLSVGDEDELPSHRTIEKLHRDSAGMPGRLAALLASGAATRNTWFPAGFPLWHVVFTLGAAVLLLWLITHLAPTAPAPAAPAEISVELPVSGPASGPELPATRLSAAAVPRPLDVRELPDGGQTIALPPPATGSSVPAAAPAPVAPATTGLTANGAANPPVSAPKPVPGRRFTAQEEALLGEKASRYTLQLFASFNERAVQDFAVRHPELPIRLFRTVREELPWHVAVTGVYRNKEEAKAAAGKLPADLSRLQPWARSLQGIQDELRRRKE